MAEDKSRYNEMNTILYYMKRMLASHSAKIDKECMKCGFFACLKSINLNALVLL